MDSNAFKLLFCSCAQDLHPTKPMEDTSPAHHSEEARLPGVSIDLGPASPRSSAELPPIASLPAELLGKIFVLVPEIEFDEAVANSLPLMHRMRGRWMGISYVCRHWRVIALNLKAFWAFIPLDLGSTWTRTCLARSHPTPISILLFLNNLQAYDKWYYDLAMDTLGDLSRTQRLREVGKPYGEHVEKIRRELGHRLATSPLLTDLFISFVNLPDNFGPSAPRLRRLALKRCTLSMDAECGIWQASLTTLKLTECSSVTNSLQVLKVVEKLPGLQTLHLSFTVHSTSPERLPHLYLPHLRDLRLVDTNGRNLEILQHLTFPSDIDMHFECSCVLRTIKLCRVLHVLAGKILSARQDLRSVSIRNRTVDMFCAAQSGMPSYPRLFLSLRCPNGMETWLETKTLQILLRSGSVEHLNIADNQDRDLTQWVNVSSHLSYVRRISFTDERLARSLAIALSHMAARSLAHTLFPNLQEIHVPSIYLKGWKADPSTWSVNEPLVSWLSWGLAQPRTAGLMLRLVVQKPVQRDVVADLRGCIDPRVEMFVDSESGTGRGTIVWFSLRQ
ncbi:hypothetical protein FA95DRAFT_613324 [Auriscalpium vulgare]|uniref:Uncharacterized protein n=1 Tax=Auriscalpium vulgare TaxID=40419 RepID=A0ACB8RDD7_9AGAM|nr:hypothetical protein FA95DRAFT_613324 [Auriscalpium vulgare]